MITQHNYLSESLLSNERTRPKALHGTKSANRVFFSFLTYRFLVRLIFVPDVVLAQFLFALVVFSHLLLFFLC